MLSQLALTLFPLPAAIATPGVPPAIIQDAEDHEAKIAAAGDDVAKLTELGEAWVAAGERNAARAAWARVVELEPDNEVARKGLGHHRYDEQWFETYAALSAYRREESKRKAAEGLGRHGDEWVPIEDLPYLRMQWVKEGGRWLHPADAERMKKEQELKAKDWKLQGDLTWVSPEETANWEKGLWKVGEDWLTKEEANKRHASLDEPWVLPGERFTIVTTVDRDSGEWAKWWADHAYDDLVRIFGVKPFGKPEVVVTNSIPQYNAFSGGDPANGRQPAETHGWSSVHYAYFADARIDPTSTPPRWRGAGTCYWATQDASLVNYGVHAVRHAAAQSYIDAIDPSWDTISGALSGGGGNLSSDTFWAEKKVPFWMRYGAASYVERFFKDPAVVDAAQKDPWWAREWAFANLRAAGGPRPLQEIFALQLDPNDPADGTKRIAESGLVVSFILDGECKPVIDAHAAFKQALVSGDGDAVAERVKALETAIIENEKAYKLYTNM